MNKKYVVRLTDQERDELAAVIKKFKGASQKVRRAQILSKADADGPNWTDRRICEAFGCRSGPWRSWASAWSSAASATRWTAPDGSCLQWRNYSAASRRPALSRRDSGQRHQAMPTGRFACWRER